MLGRATLDHPTHTEWFDTSKFQVQPSGVFGNERRNQLFGPRFGHIDMSLFKDFRAFRESSLEFRAECFNLTNTPAFAAPVNVMGPTLGAINALSPNYQERVFQFALKLTY